ncbi:ubiquitin carboxyl-terminal hydrolase 12-like [Triticum dicoccoides]|uniref:ubiquitin carboxyl-terminal hydrolase 12-like n=1 Tax=Triticum dicoccoides TaxID=85692 RepID=UPI0018900D2E|nr:ubiquitin carboxyl-terminal hydrolase 12-like [Triticum dicoccoides]XP_044456547.1 ubiquitin C-terminal hydrolase 12-like [Triticum aestivum]
MVIREDETLSSIKECLQKKLKVSDEDFSKWKFAYISLGCPDYFEDSDTVATRFQINMYGAWEQYLGLEHPEQRQERHIVLTRTAIHFRGL